MFQKRTSEYLTKKKKTQQITGRFVNGFVCMDIVPLCLIYDGWSFTARRMQVIQQIRESLKVMCSV